MAIAGVLILALAGGIGHNVQTTRDAQAVARVEEAISGIGFVTVASSEPIERVRRDFSELPPALQARVNNLAVLEAATLEFDRLLADVALVQQAVSKVQGPADCQAANEAQSKYNNLLVQTQQQLVEDAARVLEIDRDCRAAVASAEEKRKRNLIRLEGSWFDEESKNDEGVCTHSLTPQFENLSDRRMNYVWLDIIVINSVGDVAPDVNGKREHRVRVVGPIEAGSSHRDARNRFTLKYGCAEWGEMGVMSAEVEYEGGARERVENGYLQSADDWGKARLDPRR